MTITDDPRPSPFLVLIKDMEFHPEALLDASLGKTGGLDYVANTARDNLRKEYGISMSTNELRPIIEWAIIEDEIDVPS